MIPLTDVLSSNTGMNAPEITRGLWAVFIYSYLIVTVEAGEEAVQKGGGVIGIDSLVSTYFKDINTMINANLPFLTRTVDSREYRCT